MASDYYDYLSAWLCSYVASIQPGGDDCRQMFELKKKHSFMVAAEAAAIGKCRHLDEPTVALAKIAGLLHDIGRFRQYAVYRTFDDRVSVDHGRLGATIVAEKQLLKRLDQRERRAVEHVIAVHNRAAVCAGADGNSGELLRLVRDADKLDIYRVIGEFTSGGAYDGILDAFVEISDRVFADTMAGRMVAVDQVKNRSDEIVLRLAWVFDINFPQTIHRIVRRGYLQEMMAALPATSRAARLKHKLADYLRARFDLELPVKN